MNDWEFERNPFLNYKQKIPINCIIQQGKKYKERSSPPFPANECQNIIFINKKNEEKYISRPDKNDIYKWKKIKSHYFTNSAKEYYEQYGLIENKNSKKLREILKKIQNDLLEKNIIFEILWTGNEEIQASLEKYIDKKILKQQFVRGLVTDKSDYYELIRKVPFAYIRDENIFFNNNLKIIVNFMDNQNKLIVKEVLKKYLKIKPNIKNKNIESLEIIF